MLLHLWICSSSDYHFPRHKLHQTRKKQTNQTNGIETELEEEVKRTKRIRSGTEPEWKKWNENNTRKTNRKRTEKKIYFKNIAKGKYTQLNSKIFKFSWHLRWENSRKKQKQIWQHRGSCNRIEYENVDKTKLTVITMTLSGHKENLYGVQNTTKS